MSQATRGLVVASTVLAAFAMTYLGTVYWPPATIWIALASVVVLALAGDRLRAVALPAVLASIYFMPAILFALRGGETFILDFVWMMPLLGLTLSGPRAWEWSLPAKWQWPLVTWACTSMPITTSQSASAPLISFFGSTGMFIVQSSSCADEYGRHEDGSSDEPSDDKGRE